MALGGMIGNGTKVAYSDSSPVDWEAIGQIADADIPQLERAKVEATVHTEEDFERSMPGMITVSPLNLTLESDLDPVTSAAHEALRTYLLAGTTIWWRVEVPTDRAQAEYRGFVFMGYVRTWKPSAPIKDKQTTAVSIEFDYTSFTVDGPGASQIT